MRELFQGDLHARSQDVSGECLHMKYEASPLPTAPTRCTAQCEHEMHQLWSETIGFNCVACSVHACLHVFLSSAHSGIFRSKVLKKSLLPGYEQIEGR